VVLKAERTFWEKATILHEEAHRPPDDPLPLRYSRHYYDLAQIAGSPVRDAALGDLALLERVAQHKTLFFRRSWSRYDTAVPGTFRLMPQEKRIGSLERDYGLMREMMFEEPPGFDMILAALDELETTINAL